MQTLSKVVPLPCVKRVFYESDEQEAAAQHAEFRCCSDVFHLITGLLDGLCKSPIPFPLHEGAPYSWCKLLTCLAHQRLNDSLRQDAQSN